MSGARRFADAGQQLMDPSLLKKMSGDLVEIGTRVGKRLRDLAGGVPTDPALVHRINMEEVAIIAKKNLTRIDANKWDDIGDGLMAAADPQKAKKLENAKKMSSKFGDVVEESDIVTDITKKVDVLPGGDTAKRFGKADAVADAGTFCAGNKAICYSPFIFGGLYYLDEKKKNMNEKEKACMAICLPNNMDTLATSDWGGTDTEVEYTTVEDIQELQENFTQADITSGKTPVCTVGTGDECMAYCSDKCDQDYDGLGAGLIGVGVDATKAGIDFAVDTGKDVLGGVGSAFGFDKIGPYVIGFVILIVLLMVMKAMSGGRR